MSVLKFDAGRLLACMALALLGALPLDALAHACGTTPSAYFDGEGGRFDDFSDTSGFPVYNKHHCYGNPIFSTNGKDTYTSNPYGNRSMTNSGYGFQCFELAQRYFFFKYNKWIAMPAAADLCDRPLPRGIKRFRPGQGTPVPGDLFVFGRGQCGMSAQWGHVAVITKVYNAESVQIAQQNMRNERSTIANVKMSCACSILHAEDNLKTNGPPMATPDNAWSPENMPGNDGSLDTNGGNLIGKPANMCRCSSNRDDPNSIWPLCCKQTD